MPNHFNAPLGGNITRSQILAQLLQGGNRGQLFTPGALAADIGTSALKALSAAMLRKQGLAEDKAASENFQKAFADQVVPGMPLPRSVLPDDQLMGKGPIPGIIDSISREQDFINNLPETLSPDSRAQFEERSDRFINDRAGSFNNEISRLREDSIGPQEFGPSSTRRPTNQEIAQKLSENPQNIGFARQLTIQDRANQNAARIVSQRQGFQKSERVAGEVAKKELKGVKEGGIGFAKPNRENYTTESVSRAMESGNIADLVPVGADPISGDKQASVSATTLQFNNGSSSIIDNRGNRIVRLPDGTVVKGKDAEEAFKAAREFDSVTNRLKSGETAAGKSAVNRSEKLTDKIDTLRASQINIDKAVDAINDGAELGPIARFIPTFRSSTLKFQQVARDMGLGVVSSVTFGALSKGELDLALSVAVPNLDETDLKKWFLEKKKAQDKLMNSMTDAAIFLGTPGNTTADWLSIQRDIKNNRPPPQHGIDAPPGVKAGSSAPVGPGNFIFNPDTGKLEPQ